MQDEEKTYPESVELCEVGPRDGFQFERRHIPASMKVSIVEDLIRSGAKRLQIVSFVHPAKVPQMADAEEVVEALSAQENVVLTGLALNERGVMRAAASGIKYVDLSIATNDEHGADNANMTVEEGITQAETMIRLAQEAGMEAQLGLQTVWGYRSPGDTPQGNVVAMAERFARVGLESFSLADSTGMADPISIKKIIRSVRAVTDVDLVLHLHDTRGMGIANIVAALEEGVRRFDTSLGGLGGCPFIPGATGNVATEDVAYALKQLGVQTGIDTAHVARTTRRLSEFLDREFSGKMYRLLDA